MCQEFSTVLSACRGEFWIDVNSFDPIRGTSFDGHGDCETPSSRTEWPRPPAASRFFVDRSANCADTRLRVSVILVVDQDSRAIFFESLLRIRIFAAPGSKERTRSGSPHFAPQQFWRNFWMSFEIDPTHGDVRPIFDFVTYAYSTLCGILAANLYLWLRVAQLIERRTNCIRDACKICRRSGLTQPRRQLFFAKNLFDFRRREQPRSCVFNFRKIGKLLHAENKSHALSCRTAG